MISDDDRLAADLAAEAGRRLLALRARGGDPDALMDEYFERLTHRFAADPEHDAFEDWTLTVALARR